MKSKTRRTLRKETLWWSYTKLKVFEECKERFYRQYIKRQEVDDNQRRYLEGSIVHYLIENYTKERHYLTDTAGVWILDHVEPYYRQFLDDKIVRFHKNDTDEKILKSIRKSAMNAFSYVKSLGLGQEGINVIAEMEIREKINHNILLNGKIDLLVQKGDFWTIADLKNMTSRNSLLDNTQLVFYNLLLYAKFRRVADRSEFYTCKDNKTVPGRIKKKDLKTLANRVIDATKIVRKANFRCLTTDNSVCYKCPYKEICVDENLTDVGRGIVKW
jgi:CRISPR/Cas system-associated exonuclease Cas4 (RecB family)